MSEWMPIETAPKDGTSVLLYWPRYAYDYGDEDTHPVTDIGYYTHSFRMEQVHKQGLELDYLEDHWTNTDELDCYGLMHKDHQPTYWMPIPEPPKEEK